VGLDRHGGGEADDVNVSQQLSQPSACQGSAKMPQYHHAKFPLCTK
jgi:hypothetical protein